MPGETERIAFLEANSKTYEKNISQIWIHVNSLNEFKNQMEGAMRILKFMIGFIGLAQIANLAMAASKFFEH